MLNYLLLSLYIASGLSLLALAFYTPRILAWFSSFKKQTRLYNHFDNKLAIIIPARNESEVIKGLLENLKEQSYHQDKFDVFVIVKDPSDKSVDIVKSYGYFPIVNPIKPKRPMPLIFV